MKQDNNKVRLVKLLRDKPNLSAKEIGSELEINWRSVYRIVDRCVEDGYFIVHENDKFRLSSRDRDEALYDFTLTGMQAHDLVAAAENIGVLTPHALEALQEIRENLKTSSLEKGSEVYYHSYDEISPDTYTTLVSAIRSHKALRLIYLPAREGREATEHVFNPYKIIFWNGHYYLTGCSRAYAHKPSGGVMHLRLDRIGECKVATETRTAKQSGEEYEQSLTFTKVNFDARDYVERVFGTFGGKQAPVDIALHFPPQVAKAAAEVERHPSKTLEWLDDGSVIYRITVPLNPEIVWWVASWSGVRVLEPAELREQVYQHALEVAKANE